METYKILYNPNAGNGKCKAETDALCKKLGEAVVSVDDMTKVDDYAAYFSMFSGEAVVLCGGDGTVNRFVNDTADLANLPSVYYYPAGSGNDFFHDLGIEKGDRPICIDRYIRELPTVTVNGKTYRFINGVGYGIDGYCCEVGDKLRETTDKPINYAGIAIKGLLFHYKPTKAVITVDGVKHTYEKVWLAPTMNGRFYGGGMMPTPDQDRLNAEHAVSTMALHGTGKIQTLLLFPSLFKGEHIKDTKHVAVLSGKDITIEFDRPTALQIDGETLLGITSCRMQSAAPANVCETA